MGYIGPNFNQPGQLFQPAANPALQPQLPLQGGGLPLAEILQANLPNASGQAPLGLAALFASGEALTSAQIVSLLKNLLQLPKELVQLMAMLADTEGQSAQELLKALLNEDVQVPLDALQQLLQKQGAQSQEKLLKLLQNTPTSFAQAGQQLGDLLQTLSQFSEKGSQLSSSQKGMEALHTTISLYLPFYPLQAPQQFSLQAKPQSEEEGEKKDAKTSALIVFLQTINLGSLKATISTAPGSGPEIILEHGLGDEILEGLLKHEIQEGLHTERLPKTDLILVAGTGYSAPPKATVPAGGTAGERQPTHQAVKLLPGQGLSALAVLMAYALIRAVFECDNRLQARQNRSHD